MALLAKGRIKIIYYKVICSLMPSLDYQDIEIKSSR